MAHGSQKRIMIVCITISWRGDGSGHLMLTTTLKELGELQRSPPAGITVSLADESDIYKWNVVMEGPADSPYAVSVLQAISLLSLR